MSDETQFLWFYRSDSDPLILKEDGVVWSFYEESELIESSYQDYVAAKTAKQDLSSLLRYQINDDYEIDFEALLQIGINNKNSQRLVGRFAGNVVEDPTLKNTLEYQNFRWFFDTKTEENSDSV